MPVSVLVLGSSPSAGSELAWSPDYSLMTFSLDWKRPEAGETASSVLAAVTFLIKQLSFHQVEAVILGPPSFGGLGNYNH